MDDAQHFGFIPVQTASATMLLYQLPLLPLWLYNYVTVYISV
jgi:hypothetical protein